MYSAIGGLTHDTEGARDGDGVLGVQLADVLPSVALLLNKSVLFYLFRLTKAVPGRHE